MQNTPFCTSSPFVLKKLCFGYMEGNILNGIIAKFLDNSLCFLFFENLAVRNHFPIHHQCGGGHYSIGSNLSEICYMVNGRVHSQLCQSCPHCIFKGMAFCICGKRLFVNSSLIKNLTYQLDLAGR